MFSSERKFILLLSILLGLSAQSVLCSDIWQDVEKIIARTPTLPTFDEIEQYVSLLIEEKDIARDSDGNLIIADGLIKITPTTIKSFKTAGATDIERQFQIPHLFTGESTIEEGDLTGVRIDLDYLKKHHYFDQIVIGGLSYEAFGKELRDTLARHLEKANALVHFLRPENGLNLTQINVDPPQVVVSLQFNDDKQDDMTTFCGGNILASELTKENMRARFIEAALTGKQWYSADLGACMTKCCQEDLGVQPLEWQQARFEGNAAPVATHMPGAGRELAQENNFYHGFAMRNTTLNGIFALAVVSPFPDMKWVQKQCDEMGAFEWMEAYAASLTRALIKHVAQNRANYTRLDF